MPGRYPYDRPGMNGMGGYPDYGKKYEDLREVNV